MEEQRSEVGGQRSDEYEIRYLGDMQRLRLEPGDVLVLKVDRRIPEDAFVRMVKGIKSGLAFDVPVWILEGDVELGVLSTKVDAESQAVAIRLGADGDEQSTGNIQREMEVA